MDAALSEAIGGDREREAANEGSCGGDVECAQPGIGQEAGGHDGSKQEQVPGHNRPEERVERPEGECERPLSEDG
jgi:hypothetical protein